MRILILSQFCDPEPTVKGVLFAKELRNLGHDVQILTGFPNYPGGVIYPEYRIKLFQRESIEGIKILRVALYPSHDNSNIKRICSYLSFSFFASILGLLLIKRPDVIYVYYTHITIELPALIQKLLYKTKIVYDIMDLWPDTMTVNGINADQSIFKFIKTWCRFSYSKADHIVVPSPSQKKVLNERGIPANKVSVIYNWSNEKQNVPETHCLNYVFNKDHFNIVYAGNMGKAQALDVILEVAIILGNKYPSINIVFIGWGVDFPVLEQKKEREKISNVIFFPPLPISEVEFALRKADALLVHLMDIPLFEMTIPSKTQAYLAARRPIIMAVRGDAAELVERIRAGIACIPENVNSIFSAIEKMYYLPQETKNDMGNNGFNYYWQNLCLNIGVKKFDKIFNSLIIK